MSDDHAASAADPAPSGQDALNALTPEQRSTWEMTGDWPEPAKVTTTAADPDDDPAPVTTTGTEAITTAAVTTTAEPEKPVSKRQQQINDLIRKATEADIRAKALETEIAALKGKTAPEPEKKPEPVAVADPGDPEPQEANFETYGAFVLAAAKWATRQAKREADAETKKAQVEHAEQAQRASFETAAKSWGQRRDTFTANHPEKAERLLTFLDSVLPGTPIGDVLLESEVGPQVGDYLAAHPEEADRIARLAPISALRALGKLEAKFDVPVTSASASAGPAAKTVTTAPAPPMTLSARSAEPADPSEAALAAGDFSRFEAEENRKALLALR